MKENMQELVEKLLQEVYFTVNSGLAEKTLVPGVDQYIKHKVQEFEYSDEGITKFSSTSDTVVKPDWGSAQQSVLQKVEELPVYKDASAKASRLYTLEKWQRHDYFSALIQKVTWDTIQGRIKVLSDLAPYTMSFLKDLEGTERDYRVRMELRGLVLRPDFIQLDEDATLRKPVREDLETEELAVGPATVYPRFPPTAFFQARLRSTRGEGAYLLQREVDRTVLVMRLFKVGAVQVLRYTMDTDSIVDRAARVTATIGGGLPRLTPDQYLIREEDVKPLRLFWSKMKRVILPVVTSAGPQKQPNELSIAHERYSGSLGSGIAEERILNAVMGLEALWLSPGEQQEMSYRLRMRVGKLLALIGYDPYQVRDTLIDGYAVRSTYVHGGILKQKGRRRYERKYGGTWELSKVIMDYLRASIVALLRRPSKTYLIQKIDDSFFNINKEDEIRKLLFIP